MMIRRRECLIVGIMMVAVSLLCFPIVAQTVLTNESIVKMVKAGLGEDVVISSIRANPGKYVTGVDELIALKGAGVSDKIIAAMGTKMAGGDLAPAAAAAPVAAAAGPVNEIGVYYKKNETWAELPPEVVNFKTGGVLKSIGTAGIVKGDVNGHINNLHSPNVLKTPIDILVYTAEGVSITEYQLLRLRDQKESREFRTVTGGVMHVSGGATRDMMPFENKKIAPRTYEVVLPNITSGEYGLLPPAGSDSTSSSGRIGKIYSFRVLE